MDNRESNHSFNYTYSAKQQEEIKNIREKYAPPEENKIEYLRRLDAGVSQKAAMMAIIVGVAGTLLLGLGMSCAMVWEGMWFIPGIALGIIGIIVLSLAYPLYNRTLKKEREKISPEIMRLTDELLK